MNRLFLILFLFLALPTYGQRFVKTVNTIADLVAANVKDVHTNIFVADTNRGGLFTLISNQISTNNGTKFASSTAGYSWSRIYDDVLNVKWFGALGNGTQNDDGYIQNAITSLGTNGGTVFVPVGVYRITNGIFIPSGVTFRGAGFRTEVNNFVPTGGTVFNYYGASSAIAVSNSVTPIERTILQDFAIVNKSGGTIGLHLYEGRHCQFNNLYITGFTNGVVGVNFWQCRYTGVMAYNCSIGFAANSSMEDSVFENCTSRYNTLTALKINYHSQANVFIGCDFGYSPVCVEMNNGEYGGGPLTTHSSFINCQFEYDARTNSAYPFLSNSHYAVFYVDSSLNTTSNYYNVTNFPCLLVEGCRFQVAYASDAQSGATNVPIFRLVRANKVEIANCRQGQPFGYLFACNDADLIGNVILRNNEIRYYNKYGGSDASDFEYFKVNELDGNIVIKSKMIVLQTNGLAYLHFSLNTNTESSAVYLLSASAGGISTNCVVELISNPSLSGGDAPHQNLWNVLSTNIMVFTTNTDIYIQTWNDYATDAWVSSSLIRLK